MPDFGVELVANISVVVLDFHKRLPVSRDEVESET
jgi:hypothetical protein